MTLLQEIKNIPSSKKDLRSFGITVGTAFTLIWAFILWRHEANVAWLLYPAAFLLVAGFLFPVVLAPFQKAWMALALALGAVVSRVILVVLFYLVVTPIGLLTRLCGKDFLDRKFKENKDSYWHDHQRTVADKSYYENQF